MQPRASVGLVLHLLVVGLGLLGCAGSTAPGTSSAPPSGASSCDALAASARSEVQAAIDANGACTADADCIDTGFSAACFDACARAVAQRGKSAVEAAKARVDAAQCASFSAQGCKLIAPPCLPPEPPACVAGRCR